MDQDHPASAGFPIVHRDFQWSSFGDAAGFQVWCLVTNRSPLQRGNLVLVRHEEARTEHKHPVYFAADKEDNASAIFKLNHISNELRSGLDPSASG